MVDANGVPKGMYQVLREQGEDVHGNTGIISCSLQHVSDESQVGY